MRGLIARFEMFLIPILMEVVVLYLCRAGIACVGTLMASPGYHRLTDGTQIAIRDKINSPANDGPLSGDCGPPFIRARLVLDFRSRPAQTELISCLLPDVTVSWASNAPFPNLWKQLSGTPDSILLFANFFIRFYF